MAAGGASAFAETILPKTMVPDPLMWGPRQSDHLIKSPKEAINVFDLEPVCRQNVPPAHFGYMASGIDDEVTLRANREGFLKFQLRPRRLRRRQQGRHERRHPRHEILLADRLRPGRRPALVPRRRRSRRRPRRQGRRSSANPVDQTSDSGRGRHQGARRADLDAALRHQQVGGRRGHRHARREGRLHRRSRSPSTAAAAATRKRCSGCGPTTRATATAATTARACRTA